MDDVKDLIDQIPDDDPDDDPELMAVDFAHRWRSYEDRVTDIISKPVRYTTLTETAAARAACQDFCQMGFQRSFQGLIDIYRTRRDNGMVVPTTSYKTLQKWAKEFEWHKRSAEFDLKVMKYDEKQWLARRRVLQEENWQIGEQMRRTALEMLALAPKFVKQRRNFIPGDGTTPDREIITLALDAGMIPKLATAAADLQQRAIDGGDITIAKGRALQVNSDGKGAIQVTAIDYDANISVLKPKGEGDDDEAEE